MNSTFNKVSIIAYELSGVDYNSTTKQKICYRRIQKMLKYSNCSVAVKQIRLRNVWEKLIMQT